MSTKEQWRESIQPRIKIAQETLKRLDLGDLSKRSGSELRGDSLALSLFATPLRISLPGFEVQSVEGKACPEKTQILVLDYLTHSLGFTSPSVAEPSWLGFQELPNGAFYVKAFRSYTSAALLKELDGDIGRFRRAAERFGGTPISLGDAAAKFRALPNIDLAVVWWAGDDEFPATANVLFDSAAANALPIDGMAALGGLLCQGLLSADPDE